MNTLITAIFLFISLVILTAAIMAVTVKNIVHAALWLIASFFGVAALYMLLEAEFAAVVQVLIYVGAISILVLFAIMLTRRIDDSAAEYPSRARFWGALVLGAALFGLLLAPTLYSTPWRTVQPGQNTAISSVVQLGQAFMREYLLPFEVASILLLVALVGAVVIAFEERGRRRRVLTLAEEVALRQSEEQRTKNEEQQADGTVLTVDR
ncbi:MAG TPA: NADH-quinone oxidoreductase subunit J [Roseiflexaceae bacterium]|jgi:NADH-quinone oxidoreductase subunit J|nr:NADH-quinone oxidoreductase subunit J [Roseiflexaceae bacterium]